MKPSVWPPIVNGMPLQSNRASRKARATDAAVSASHTTQIGAVGGPSARRGTGGAATIRRRPACAPGRSGGAFRRRLKRYADDQRSDLAYAFLIFRSDDNALVGGLTLANIRRGVAQAGTIGYWIGAPFARKGYMTAAVRALVPFCFGTLRLHRLEAACIPGNTASIRLLEKTGFKREGYARSYLCINGIWQDHLLYARLKDDPE